VLVYFVIFLDRDDQMSLAGMAPAEQAAPVDWQDTNDFLPAYLPDSVQELPEDVERLLDSPVLRELPTLNSARPMDDPESRIALPLPPPEPEVKPEPVQEPAPVVEPVVEPVPEKEKETVPVRDVESKPKPKVKKQIDQKKRTAVKSRIVQAEDTAEEKEHQLKAAEAVAKKKKEADRKTAAARTEVAAKKKKDNDRKAAAARAEVAAKKKKDDDRKAIAARAEVAAKKKKDDDRKAASARATATANKKKDEERKAAAERAAVAAKKKKEADSKAAAIAKKEADRKAAAARVATAKKAAERKAAAEKLAASRASGGSGSAPRAQPVGGGGSSASADTGWYDQLIKQTFESNWREPKLTTGQNLYAKVRITVAPDGRVVGARFVHQSNVRAMDDSVVAALRATTRIPRPLPGELAKGNYTFLFTFKLTP
jgi:colicin import membrane protein